MSAAPIRHARVERLRAPSGNRDADYFQPACAICGWKGALYSNRTAEGRALAERVASDHRCPTKVIEPPASPLEVVR